MYYEVQVMVAGAAEDMREFDTWDEVEEFVEEQRRAAAEDGLRTEIYLVEHEHEHESKECSCAQYITDHKPEWTFGGEES